MIDYKDRAKDLSAKDARELIEYSKKQREGQESVLESMQSTFALLHPVIRKMLVVIGVAFIGAVAVFMFLEKKHIPKKALPYVIGTSGGILTVGVLAMVYLFIKAPELIRHFIDKRRYQYTQKEHDAMVKLATQNSDVGGQLSVASQGQEGGLSETDSVGGLSSSD